VSPIEDLLLKGGLLGDKVIEIDGEDMTGVTPEEARLKVLARKAQRFTNGGAVRPEPLKFVITRAQITIRSRRQNAREGLAALTSTHSVNTTRNCVTPR
jgi:C-terminal processing protease CtpA/Prc